MKLSKLMVTPLAAGALIALSAPASAQSASGQDSSAVPPAGTPPSQLPEPVSDDDPRPPVAQPTPPAGGIVEQAGVGGPTGYGRTGVLELGGSAGLTASSEFMAASFSPSVGWFFANNVQLSGILGVSHVATEEQDATMVSMLVEPSYHLPFTREFFGFLGMGMGAAHVQDEGVGFALAPRIGANIMIGRSGVLTPALSYQYTTHDAVQMPDGDPAVAVSTALMANIGYTVLW